MFDLFYLKQFDQEDCRAFDREYKEAEKRLMSGRANDECRDRLDSIRNKYRSLVNMSNLFSRSFSNIDNLTSRFDDFTSVLCNMEEQLESQSIVDMTSTNQLREEMDTISVSYLFMTFQPSIQWILTCFIYKHRI